MQISDSKGLEFLGGCVDENDKSPWQTATREVAEETNGAIKYSSSNLDGLDDIVDSSKLNCNNMEPKDLLDNMSLDNFTSHFGSNLSNRVYDSTTKQAIEASKSFLAQYGLKANSFDDPKFKYRLYIVPIFENNVDLPCCGDRELFENKKRKIVLLDHHELIRSVLNPTKKKMMMLRKSVVKRLLLSFIVKTHNPYIFDIRQWRRKDMHTDMKSDGKLSKPNNVEFMTFRQFTDKCQTNFITNAKEQVKNILGTKPVMPYSQS